MCRACGKELIRSATVRLGRRYSSARSCAARYSSSVPTRPTHVPSSPRQQRRRFRTDDIVHVGFHRRRTPPTHGWCCVSRRGFTLIELTVASAIIGIVSLIALPAVARMRERAAVHGATSLLVSSLADARHQALRWQRRTAVRFDTAHARTVVHAGSDTLVRVALDSLFHVTLASTRDSIAFYPTGLGYGAANTRLIVARGASAETVTVSRAGRVKR